MKELLIVVSLLLSGVAAEAPAPYAPSGWRPEGPSFELPARVPAQSPQKQEYLPPVDPRRPATPTEFDSGDVSVQGLPTVEQQPIFQLSPINGQQYAGPNYQADLRNLDRTLQQIQYLQQLEKQREFTRQKQFEAARGNAANGLPNPQPPRGFVPQTTPSTTTTTSTQKPEFRTETSTEPLDLNEGEDYDSSKDAEKSTEKPKVAVEVTKQNIQEYPPELFLTPLTQFKVHPQFLQIQQLGQLRSPLYFQPQQQDQESQKAEGFSGPAHFAALPSVLAQQQLLTTQAQPASQSQNVYSQNPALVITRGQEQPTPAYIVPQETLTQSAINSQYQPLVQPQVQAFPQFQAQPVILPQQTSNQLQPNQYVQTVQREPEAEEVENDKEQEAQRPQLKPQFVYQAYQPQDVYQQPFPVQPVVASQYQPQQAQQSFIAQPEAVNQYQNQQVYQQTFPAQPEPQYQPQQVYQQPFPTQPQAQYQSQQVYQQPFPAQPEPQYQPQQVYQQPFTVQPQAISQVQPQDQQNAVSYQPQLINYPAQDWNQYYQQQLYQQQFADPNAVQQQKNFQGQDSLQSGLDVNQEGNGIDDKEESDDEAKDEQNQDDGSRATAVATAFGARTQPRVFLQYGAPVSRPQVNPGDTTDSPQEETTDEGPAVAQATAVATGSRKSAKLRSRRVRPVFTLDRSGHLVLAQDQQN